MRVQPAHRQLLFILLISLIIVATLLIYRLWPRNHPSASPMLPTDYYKTHIIGGFSVDTPNRATQAASTGIQVVFKYGQPPAENDSLGRTLQAHHMKVIDGYISSMLHYYECQRLQSSQPLSAGIDTYCPASNHPYFVNEDAFLSTVAVHLQAVVHNNLVIGYWVLDDWFPDDAGSARPLLVKIHHLIQHYTPGRVAICGFGGGLAPDGTNTWSDWIAQNFTPQGCDAVGLYVYSTAIANYKPANDRDFDWSMSRLLPAVFHSLQQRGWNMSKKPLIGISQAFGGPINHKNFYRQVPTAQDIEIQTRSFCTHGATGIAFYGWGDSEFTAQSSQPMNSDNINEGIHQGIAACVQHWSGQR